MKSVGKFCCLILAIALLAVATQAFAEGGKEATQAGTARKPATPPRPP